MIRSIFQSLGTAHAIAALVLGAYHFSLWKRSGYRLPRYLHGLAFFALAVGVWLASGLSPDSPAGRWGIGGQLFILLICPALVYGFFILHGGTGASLRRRGSDEFPRGR